MANFQTPYAANGSSAATATLLLLHALPHARLSLRLLLHPLRMVVLLHVTAVQVGGTRSPKEHLLHVIPYL